MNEVARLAELERAKKEEKKKLAEVNNACKRYLHE